MKKVALVGNMNNNFFSITRYLRDRGYEAQLFFRNIHIHFEPKSDTLKLDYLNYCHSIDEWSVNGFYYADKNKIRNTITSFDFVISQGDMAAYLNKAGVKVNLYFPYGSDIYKYAYLSPTFSIRDQILSFFRRGEKKITYKQMKQGTIHKYLKEAIRTADFIFAEKTNEDFEKKLFGLNLEGVYKPVPMPFVYLKEYLEATNSDNFDVHWKSVVDEIRKKNKLIVLYHGRQEWKTYWNDFTSKNTHYLIYGFAAFVKRNTGLDAHLVMVEYGSDTQASKELIKKLDIEKYVTWMPKMFRKDLFYLISKVDICTGEFGRSYLTFGTIVEAMSMGKPVIHYREDELYFGVYPDLYPLLNAKMPAEIEQQLQNYVNDPEKYQKMGKEAQAWINKYFIDEAVNKICELIEEY